MGRKLCPHHPCPGCSQSMLSPSPSQAMTIFNGPFTYKNRQKQLTLQDSMQPLQGPQGWHIPVCVHLAVLQPLRQPSQHPAPGCLTNISEVRLKTATKSVLQQLRSQGTQVTCCTAKTQPAPVSSLIDSFPRHEIHIEIISTGFRLFGALRQSRISLLAAGDTFSKIFSSY